jgi:hypothetical protein
MAKAIKETRDNKLIFSSQRAVSAAKKLKAPDGLPVGATV